MRGLLGANAGSRDRKHGVRGHAVPVCPASLPMLSSSQLASIHCLIYVKLLSSYSTHIYTGNPSSGNKSLMCASLPP